MKQILRFSVEGANDGVFNMAEDVALLHAAESGRPGARFYHWDGIWVSLGRFQSREDALLPGAELRTCLRPTGGAAVLHGHDLTLGIALPFGLLGTSPREVKRAYEQLVRPILTAFEVVGIRAQMAGNSSAARSEYCFAMASPYDLVDSKGSKLAGCALRATRKAALLQVSIPVRPPKLDPIGLLHGAVKDRVRMFDEVLFINAMAAAWREQFDLNVELDFVGPMALAQRVRLLLWNVWDPIGVNNQASAADEYDAYPEFIVRSHSYEAELQAIAIGMGLPPTSGNLIRTVELLQNENGATC